MHNGCTGATAWTSTARGRTAPGRPPQTADKPATSGFSKHRTQCCRYITVDALEQRISGSGGTHERSDIVAAPPQPQQKSPVNPPTEIAAGVATTSALSPVTPANPAVLDTGAAAASTINHDPISTDLVTAPPQRKRPSPCLSTNQHRQRPKINKHPSINRSPSTQPVQSFCFSYTVVNKKRHALRFRPHSQGALVTRVDASLAKQHPQLHVGRIVYRINTTGSRASPISADVAKSMLERGGDFTVHTATQ